MLTKCIHCYSLCVSYLSDRGAGYVSLLPFSFNKRVRLCIWFSYLILLRHLFSIFWIIKSRYLYGRFISCIALLLFVYLQYIGLGRGSYSDFLLQWHRVGSTHNHGQLQQIPQQMSQVLSIIFQRYFGTVKIPKTQYDSINTVFSEIFKFL